MSEYLNFPVIDHVSMIKVSDSLIHRGYLLPIVNVEF